MTCLVDAAVRSQSLLSLHQGSANCCPGARADPLPAIETLFLEQGHTHSFTYDL